MRPKQDPLLPIDLKVRYNMFDFIMLEYGAPMNKDPDTDILIIENIPHRKGYENA